MKKNFLKIFIVIFVTSLTSYNYFNSKKDNFSNLLLENIEALASGENGGSGDEEDTDCKKCTTSLGSSGATFFCKAGTGGCYSSSCAAGSCF